MNVVPNKLNFQTIFCILIFLLLLNPVFVYAGKNDKKEVLVQEQPISVFADYIHYDKETGDLFAEGNVRLVRGDQVVLADRVDGNVNSADIWTKVQTRFEQGSTNTNLVGDAANYNYEDRTGKIENISGTTSTQYVKAKDAEIFPEKMVVNNAMMSRCSANNTKCYHITAERIDIWPNDKIIAYNVKVYLLGKKLITRSRYIVSLNGEGSEVPRVGYSNDNGLYLKYTLSYPIDYKTAVGVDLYAATKVGGRSTGWIRHTEKNLLLEYSYGYYEDDDSEWIKKENNIRVVYGNQQLFKLPLKYRFWFERGFWIGSGISSWHTEFGGYLSADTIYFGKSKSTWLSLGAGFRRLQESYNSIKENEYRYDIGLHKKISSKWEVGAVYSKVINNVSLFAYNRVDVPNSLTYSIKWQPDHLNKLEFLQQYDTEYNRVYKSRINYTRNLHCWDFILSFERERPMNGKYNNKIRFDIQLAI